MQFVSKLTPEQWAEARRLRAGGELYRSIANRFGLTAAAIGKRARKEGWPPPAGSRPSLPARRPNNDRAAAAGLRRTLMLRLLAVIDLRIGMLERCMQRRLQAQNDGRDAGTAAAEPGDMIAALIDSINRVMALDQTAP